MAMVKPAITILTIDISLMRILRDGPEVSLNGSPTVTASVNQAASDKAFPSV